MRTFKPRLNDPYVSKKDKTSLPKGKLTKKQTKKHIEFFHDRNTSIAKLKSQGLWDHKQNKTKLTVRRINDLSPEERKEMGLD
jgi:hypothetical protein